MTSHPDPGNVGSDHDSSPSVHDKDMDHSLMNDHLRLLHSSSSMQEFGSNSSIHGSTIGPKQHILIFADHIVSKLLGYDEYLHRRVFSKSNTKEPDGLQTALEGSNVQRMDVEFEKESTGLEAHNLSLPHKPDNNFSPDFSSNYSNLGAQQHLRRGSVARSLDMGLLTQPLLDEAVMEDVDYTLTVLDTND
jgi:hypothetical protein